MLRGSERQGRSGAGGMLRGCGAPWEVLRSPLMLLSSKGVKGCPGRGGRAGWEEARRGGRRCCLAAGGGKEPGCWMSGAGPSRSLGWILVATHRGQGSSWPRALV